MDKNKQKHQNELWIAYVSTFPPRECGIATFTDDITTAMDGLLHPAVKSKIIAMNTDEVSAFKYPKKVISQICQDNPDDYLRTAGKINAMDEICLVNVQHEFGIFGGEYGLNLLPFLKTVTKPVVLTFHSVLPGPNEKLHGAVRLITEHAQGVMVMTNYSKNILINDYGMEAGKISVIPHGIHPRMYSSSKLAKSLLGFPDKTVLSTFGLLGPGKGLEYVIEALPEVVRKFPNLVYIIFGVTHPNILRKDGESYRNSLIEKVRALGLSGFVKFYNRYFSVDELLQFLKATDIYVSTSLDPNQSVSGTLSYALGTGRPVVSTAFAQAKEDVTPETGMLVDFRNPAAYAGALNRILGDDDLRMQMGKHAYFRTRKMIWPNVAIEYLKCFSKHAAKLSAISEQKNIPKINLGHMSHLTDDFGIVQFAKLTNPDPSSGHTIDDNARALIVACKCAGKPADEIIFGDSSPRKRDIFSLIRIYMRFIEHVSDDGSRFHNYVDSDRTINKELNRKDSLDDANGRTLFALAVAATTGACPQDMRDKAFGIFEAKFEKDISFDSPRANAYYIKALCLLHAKGKLLDGRDIEPVIRGMADKMVSWYNGSSSPEWQWFESSLTYSNGLLPEALLLAYQVTNEKKYMETGKTALDFLIRQSFIDDIYVPIGQAGWCQKGGKRSFYDQQPEEAQAMVFALQAGLAVLNEPRYKRLMNRAFCWFLGDNTIKQVVYDCTNGGCFDGLGEKYINLNQGAESTVSYLLARLCF
ncbi:MAG: glycosyltransferase [Elusimicrobiota bacterium]